MKLWYGQHVDVAEIVHLSPLFVSTSNAFTEVLSMRILLQLLIVQSEISFVLPFVPPRSIAAESDFTKIHGRLQSSAKDWHQK
jgi:hypothetical protein